MAKEKGYIYILTNPSFPDQVKIGYADNVETRLRTLNNSPSIPYAFRIYDTYEVNTRLTDFKVHNMIDKLNPDLRSVENYNGKKRVREFYAMSAETAYSIFEAMAHVRTMGAGNRVASWGCCSRMNNGRSVCDSHHVREDVLERTYTAAIQQITESADEEVTAAVSEGAMLTMEPENSERLEAVEQAIIETQEQALMLHKKKVAHQITDAEYKDAIEKCSQRMKELETEQAKLQTVATRYSEVKAWLDTFEENVRSDDIMDANDALVMKALVDEIIVNDTGIEIHCKCGITIEQEYVK